MGQYVENACRLEARRGWWSGLVIVIVAVTIAYFAGVGFIFSVADWTGRIEVVRK